MSKSITRRDTCRFCGGRGRPFTLPPRPTPPRERYVRPPSHAGGEPFPPYFTARPARATRAQPGPAAVLTANNVFANIDNLEDFSAGIRELLAPDGVFVFETSYLLDVLANTLLETFFHEHISYFSVKPLEAYFRRFGMELFDVERV